MRIGSVKTASAYRPIVVRTTDQMVVVKRHGYMPRYFTANEAIKLASALEANCKLIDSVNVRIRAAQDEVNKFKGQEVQTIDVGETTVETFEVKLYDENSDDVDLDYLTKTIDLKINVEAPCGEVTIFTVAEATRFVAVLRKAAKAARSNPTRKKE